MNKPRGTMIAEQMQAFLDANRATFVDLENGAELFRVQESKYTEPFHFHVPSNPNKMGRYDSTSHGSCYLAMAPEVALAETFRQGPNASSTPLNLSDLDLYNVSVLQVNSSKGLRLLDIGSMLPFIDATLDELTGVDRTLAQAISQFIAVNPAYGIDGIVYRSRHLDTEPCIVLYNPPCSKSTLKSISLTPISSFTCPKSGMDGESLLTQKVNIPVINNM